MIGIPFELDLSSLPPAFAPKAIDRETFHFPEASETGEPNNIDQIGAWSLAAAKSATDPIGGSSPLTCLENAREWILHELRGDSKGRFTDEPHFFLPGVRHYLREIGKYRTDRPNAVQIRKNEAQAMMGHFGPRSFGNLARYAAINPRTGKPWYEPRCLGRALSNCAAYAYHQIETGGEIPDLSLLSKAVRQLHPDNFLLDESNPASTGWGVSSQGVPYLVLVQGRTYYQPKDEDPYWHYIPWQYFHTLAYGLLECYGLLDKEARLDTRDILAGLHDMAAAVTNPKLDMSQKSERWTCWGAGGETELAEWNHGKEPIQLLALETVTESAAEHSYSFRWLSEDARPGADREHVGFQPTCLPLKDREAFLEDVVRIP